MDKKHFNGVCETFAENTCCQVKHETTCVILLHVYLQRQLVSFLKHVYLNMYKYETFSDDTFQENTCNMFSQEKKYRLAIPRYCTTVKAPWDFGSVQLIGTTSVTMVKKSTTLLYPDTVQL